MKHRLLSKSSSFQEILSNSSRIQNHSANSSRLLKGVGCSLAFPESYPSSSGTTAWCRTLLNAEWNVEKNIKYDPLSQECSPLLSSSSIHVLTD